MIFVFILVTSTVFAFTSGMPRNIKDSFMGPPGLANQNFWDNANADNEVEIFAENVKEHSQDTIDLTFAYPWLKTFLDQERAKISAH